MSSERPTPRCDGMAFEVQTREFGNVEVVPYDEACTLERENSALREDLKALEHNLTSTLVDVCNQRDALREERDTERTKRLDALEEIAAAAAEVERLRGLLRECEGKYSVDLHRRLRAALAAHKEGAS